MFVDKLEEAIDEPVAALLHFVAHNVATEANKAVLFKKKNIIRLLNRRGMVSDPMKCVLTAGGQLS